MECIPGSTFFFPPCNELFWMAHHQKILKASQNRIFNFASFYLVYLLFGSPISLCKFLYRVPSLWLTYLSMKQGSLFCFVLFCHAEISQTMALREAMFLASSKSSPWVRVHQLGLRLFGSSKQNVYSYIISLSPFSA